MQVSASDPACGRADGRLLWFVSLNVLVVNMGFRLIAHFVFHTGVDSMLPRYQHFLRFYQAADSWDPMLGSVNYYLAHPSLPIYGLG